MDRDHTSNTADLEPSTNLGRQLSLSTAQDNVQEFLAGRHGRNLAVKRISMGFFGRKPFGRVEIRTSFHVVFMMGHRSQAGKCIDSEVGGCWGVQLSFSTKKLFVGHFSAGRPANAGTRIGCGNRATFSGFLISRGQLRFMETL